MDLTKTYQTLLAEISRLAAAAPLAGGHVPQLVAVSKTHPAETIEPLLNAGHRLFGENRVQEAKAKWPVLRKKYPDVELHLIGPLQSNKAEEAVALFDVIETLDREKIVRALAAAEAKQGRQLAYFIQVNTGLESQKSGISAKDLPEFLPFCRNHGLNVTGLMCIPPFDEPAAPHFALLHQLARDYGLPHHSMGMSGDYDEAIRFGATHLRLGTALFGERG